MINIRYAIDCILQSLFYFLYTQRIHCCYKNECIIIIVNDILGFQKQIGQCLGSYSIFTVKWCFVSTHVARVPIYASHAVASVGVNLSSNNNCWFRFCRHIGNSPENVGIQLDLCVCVLFNFCTSVNIFNI